MDESGETDGTDETEETHGTDHEDEPEETREASPGPRFDETTGELQLEYPTSWIYKVIGADEEGLRRVVGEVMVDEEISVEVSNRSSGGKYVSLDVRVVVVSDEHRVGLYESLRERRQVKIVL